MKHGRRWGIRIAFFTKQLPSDSPNGVSVQVHRLASGLVELGHELTCHSFSPPVEGASYKHVQLAYPSGSKLTNKFVPALRFRSLKKSRYEILHFHGDDYLTAGRSTRIRTFYGSALDECLHARKPSRFSYQLLFYLFEWVSCLRRGTTVGISQATKRSLPLIGEVVPCGVPLDDYSPGNRKTQHPSFLFIGDLDSRKGGRELLAAFGELILPQMPDARLRVVGPQPCEGRNVEYLGRIDEKRLIEEYRQAWVYCMTSTYEGFGVPIIEAMACGCAVAAVASPGAGEIITHNVNGLLGSRETFPQDALRLLSDPALRQRLVDNGLRSVRAYDIRAVVRRYEELYRQAEARLI